MDKSQQAEKARTFAARHRAAPPALLIPNAWDALSAKLFVAAGFDMLATTSGGVAWALGYADGENAPWAEIVAATNRIARFVPVPVSADIEGGYAATPDEVAAHVADIIEAGAVGINLEDSRKGVVRDQDDAVARIKAARQAADRAGVPIVINARCDVIHRAHGEEAGRMATALERCKAYLAAGADCVYPFGLRQPAEISAFVKAVGGPVNVTGRAGMPDAAALSALGAARITIATAPTLVAASAIQKLAVQLRADGKFDGLDTPLHHPDLQKLFAAPAKPAS